MVPIACKTGIVTCIVTVSRWLTHGTIQFHVRGIITFPKRYRFLYETWIKYTGKILAYTGTPPCVTILLASPAWSRRRTTSNQTQATQHIRPFSNDSSSDTLSSARSSNAPASNAPASPRSSAHSSSALFSSSSFSSALFSFVCLIAWRLGRP